MRIPGWVKRDQIKTSVDDKAVRAQRAGRHLLFTGLAPNADICLEFPLPTGKEKYTIDGKEYTLEFRGSTLIDVSPRPADDPRPPIFRRTRMKAAKAPLHRVQRFVADKVIPLP